LNHFPFLYLNTHQTEEAGGSQTKTGKHSLFLFDGVVTGITNSNLELEAHDRVTGAFAAALPTDGLPAFPTVMLPGKQERKTGVSLFVNTQGFPLKVRKWEQGRYTLKNNHLSNVSINT
jgi:hypothetical protein